MFKNKFLIISFTALTILGIIFAIYYVDNILSFNSLDEEYKLKNYSQFKSKILPLTSLDNQDRVSKAIDVLEDTNTTEAIKYQALTDLGAFIASLYSTSNDSKYRILLSDLDSFAKENFPKSYETKVGFATVCQDPSCAENPPSQEVLSIINKVKSSDLPSPVKDNLALELLNNTYIESKYRSVAFDGYFLDLGVIKNYLDSSPSSSKKIVYDELLKFIKKNYPEEAKQNEI